MEFISAEEFLKQDKEVQKVFLDWFENEACSYDIVVFKNDLQYVTFYGDIEYQESFNYEDSYIPLLTEGQLREFIEDKTKDIVLFDCDDLGNNKNWYIHKTCKAYDVVGNENLGDDLLQAYWKIAIEIAKHQTRR